jgi:hypothetical protein
MLIPYHKMRRATLRFLMERSQLAPAPGEDEVGVRAGKIWWRRSASDAMMGAHNGMNPQGLFALHRRAAGTSMPA